MRATIADRQCILEYLTSTNKIVNFEHLMVKYIVEGELKEGWESALNNHGIGFRLENESVILTIDEEIIP